MKLKLPTPTLMSNEQLTGTAKRRKQQQEPKTANEANTVETIPVIYRTVDNV